MKLEFYKYHGLGNDFILFEVESPSSINHFSPKVIKHLCNSNFGIGADGILFFRVLRDLEGSVEMTYFNADGNRAETCYNGLRCIALHTIRRNVVPIDTSFTIVQEVYNVNAKADTNGKLIAIRVPGPSFKPCRVPVNSAVELINVSLNFCGNQIAGTALSLGNPHFVSWAERRDLKSLNDEVIKVGAKVENSEHFPKGVNFELASKISEDAINLSIWERGVGQTLACGSGAVAAVCAGVKLGYFSLEQPVSVKMLGGELEVKVLDNFQFVEIKGTATFVFKGEIDINE